MSLKVSIIVPVYNSEQYILRCINSLTSQTYQNMEVIIVDDGSTDNSGKICDECAHKDFRIKVIHQKNGGTSKARNTGLREATGDYVTFIDNDDYWNNCECLGKMVSYLEESKADVLMHSCYVYWMDTEAMVPPRNHCRRECIVNKPVSDALRHIILSRGIDRCVWSKVMKASVIRENQIYFPEGMRNEDIYFVGILLSHIKSIDWMEDAFYVY